MRRTTTGGVAAFATAIALLVGACGSSDDSGGGVKADQNAGGTVGKGTTAKKGGELTVGLAEEPDQLDPTLARTLVGRIVFTSICEKLYDIDDKLAIVPQLASALPEISADGQTVTIKLRDGVKFADGTTMDAAAVKTSLDRHRTLKESGRATELAPVSSVEVVDPSTVEIKLKTPFAPLTAQLADRAGMIMSPSAQEARRQLRHQPGLRRAVQVRQPQRGRLDRGRGRAELLRRGEGPPRQGHLQDHRRRDARPQTCARATSRCSTGSRRPTSDAQGGPEPADAGGDLARVPGNHHQHRQHQRGRQAAREGQHAARVAAEAAPGVRRRDRPHGHQQGRLRHGVEPACGPISRSARYTRAAQVPEPRRRRAKKLVQESGAETPVKVKMMINTTRRARLGQAIQAQAKEGGFDLEAAADRVRHLARPDRRRQVPDVPDRLVRPGRPGRQHRQLRRQPGSQNISGYKNDELDALLDKARATDDVAERKDLYGQVMTMVNKDRPLIYLYREKNFTGAPQQWAGAVYGDGLMRFGTPASPPELSRRCARSSCAESGRPCSSCCSSTIVSSSASARCPATPPARSPARRATRRRCEAIRRVVRARPAAARAVRARASATSLHGDLGGRPRPGCRSRDTIVHPLPVTLQLALLACVIALADRHPGGDARGACRAACATTRAATAWR